MWCSGMLFVAAVIGGVFSALWFKCIQWAQGRVVLMSVVVNVILSLVISIMYFAIGLSGFAVPFLIWTIWCIIWIIWVKARIPLAEATLSAATKSLADNW